MKNILSAAMLFAAPLHAATVLIDFGSSSTTNGNGPTTGQPQIWNNVTNTAAHTTGALNNTAGVSTGITLTLGGAFQGPASEAPKPVSGPYPDTATGDAFYQNVPVTLTLNNLNPAETYNITIYGFISRDAANSRLTAVTINGNTQTYQASTLNGANPNGGGTTFTGISPNGSNAISIGLDRGAGNTNFHILGVMEITSIPEPSVPLLSLLGTVPLLRRRRSAR